MSDPDKPLNLTSGMAVRRSAGRAARGGDGSGGSGTGAAGARPAGMRVGATLGQEGPGLYARGPAAAGATPAPTRPATGSPGPGSAPQVAPQAAPAGPGRRETPPAAPGPGRTASPPAAGTGPARSPDRWGAGGFIRAGMFVLLILVGGLGTWSALASLSGAVVASGQLRVETKRQVVQHLDGGSVGEILVRDGDVVAAGDVLVVLDGKQLRSELAALEGQLYELIARRGRLTAEQFGDAEIAFDPELLDRAASEPDVARLVQGQRALFEARTESMTQERATLSERQEQIREQIAGTQAQLDSINEQRDIAAEELESARRLLEQGLIQRPRVLALEREMAGLLGQEGNLSAEIARLKGQIAEIGIQILQIGTSAREDAVTELRDIEVRELELRQQRIALVDRLSRLEIRAPRAGVVQEMAINTIGAVVRPAEPILYIVPTDVSLVIEARVALTSRDQVRAGMPASLSFSSFSRRTTPVLLGTVDTVSADAIQDPLTGEQYYLAIVDVTDEELARLGDRELVAGMPVEVFVRTGERSPFSYLMKPFTDYLNRAFREE